ncbi:RagB/SusD family nutrient uptake outer membrane protein [Albibacterium bauzanense]|uniref:RagB/SusD domain-containing protein n=1 Tax=Albibacterium bauzanense TaxID=653929 RepID=A0A4R1M3C8_9SPHI|nr:RagB/SusD family nutrient uptake outer membrane protein [Albibacterium bauzanense]TCK85580.1 RagB/SusD domain-containing protein [Albibacterium bauzanense]
MKHLRYFILFVIASITFSCNNFLEVQPQESISDESTITNGSSAETAVRGMYRALASNSYYGSTFQSIGYLSGDNIQWTGSQAIAGQFVNHDVRADNGSVAAVWSAIYTTINRANNVIAKVSTLALEPTFTQEKKDQLVGEAYFVRALAYFDLVRLWGTVPIYLAPTLSINDNHGKAKSSKEEVYAQVLADLKAAETLLPQTTNRIRATRKTVWALRSRYHLYNKEWAAAESYADKVIADQSYNLIAPYSSFFANNAVATQESVFELSYSATNTSSHRGNWQPPQNGGTRQWAPNSEFLALINDPLIGGNRSAMVSSTSDGRWYGNMYYRSPATDPAYVIRIAEIRLIRAEARAQQGKYEDALKDLDAVRERAGLGASSADGKDEIFLAIEQERRLEFAFEPHRWFDLVRTDRAEAVLGLSDRNRYVLPIPIDELKVDPALEPNEGYL